MKENSFQDCFGDLSVLPLCVKMSIFTSNKGLTYYSNVPKLLTKKHRVVRYYKPISKLFKMQ